MTTIAAIAAHDPATTSAPLRRSLGKRLGLQPGDALVIVDMQRDFLPGGSLAVAGANEIVPRLNAYIAAFTAQHLPIFLTRDWHPGNHCSFRRAGGRWPVHCVQGTAGAQWARGLNIVPGARVISKGTDPSAEAYSGFSGTQLPALLRDLDVRRLFVGGVATDYCVRATVLDARGHGFEVAMLADAIRSVDAQPGDGTRAIGEMLAHGATLFQPSRRPRRSRTAAREQ